FRLWSASPPLLLPGRPAAYGHDTQSQVRSYKSQLYDLKQSTDTATVYLQHAKAIADNLAALNDPVSETDFVPRLLSLSWKPGLPFRITPDGELLIG
ncbi:hypothetical protein LINPERHAP2_LOCUS32626, partial [Linum perenne]